ncbi:hypothetical protein [Methyloceanibacter marginalis]|uniref:hypothetical protein n=1 Tax=Methyloceanibacter marginalis TaxID=1774971 RepID=UPI001FCDCFDF|nr:hypothetical protein [Methyloceanibacter marginalis]
MAAPLTLADLAVPLSLEPMEAKLVSELPDDGEWQFEPKWDAFAASLSAPATTWI